MNRIESVKNEIENLRAQKYQCAAATALGIIRGLDIEDIDEKTVIAATAGLCGGIGRTRSEGTCGAVTGAVVALGLIDQEESSRVVEMSKKLVERFQSEFGTLQCGRLIAEHKKANCTQCCIRSGMMAADLLNK